ncbi:AAA family ATPase [Thalassomonas sp. M1454]|nr:AAA family ATPase [Thalassomonas sp. M1454]
MAIKAIGVITGNNKDGKQIEVDWQETYEKPREWYFFTGRNTVWKIEPGDWAEDALIDFTFNGQDQDYKRFTSHPFWKERFGDLPEEDIRFKWTGFYHAVSNALGQYHNDRKPLIDFTLQLAEKYDLSYMKDKELVDIDPFTFMGIFNRGMTDDNRQKLATEIALFLNVEESAPDSFEAIPILNNQKSCFFWGWGERDDNDIENLWELFEVAKLFADESDSTDADLFCSLYTKVAAQKGIRWNLTMGLYWIRPWIYPTLESQSQEYLSSLSIRPQFNGPKKSCSGEDYLLIRDNLLLRFAEDAFPVHSFPELSLNAWQKPTLKKIGEKLTWKSAVLSRVKDLCLAKESPDFTRVEFQQNYLDELKALFPDNNSAEFSIDSSMQKLRDEGEIEFVKSGEYSWLGFDDGEIDTDEATKEVIIEPYDISNIIEEGCFLNQATLDTFLGRLKHKKNIILQGPPGTGKTWLGKKLAYALIGQKQTAYIKAVQFHPNLSYEDFIKGWRPTGEGKLELCDGPFLEFVKLAQQNPSQKYVVVIEEINRGNPAQIFGEMLTLLEADKRTPSEALELSYRKEGDEPVYIPGNLYVIGTMNVADRSLALVDLALRRRFAFINLCPTLGKPWREWVHTKAKIEYSALDKIEAKLNKLNDEIAADSRLGVQFQVGHSYVTPAINSDIKDAMNWFTQVVETEIFPLLEEYWYDDPAKALSEKAALLKDL